MKTTCTPTILLLATEAERMDYLGEVLRSGVLPARWNAYLEE